MAPEVSELVSVYACVCGVLTAAKVDGSVVGKGAAAVTLSVEVECVSADTPGGLSGVVGVCAAAEEPSDGEEVSHTATVDGCYVSLTVIS